MIRYGALSWQVDFKLIFIRTMLAEMTRMRKWQMPMKKMKKTSLTSRSKVFKYHYNFSDAETDTLMTKIPLTEFVALLPSLSLP